MIDRQARLRVATLATAAILAAMWFGFGGGKSAVILFDFSISPRDFEGAEVIIDGEVVTARGECPGRILEAPRGGGGFGYDPVFEVAPGTAMAELPTARKNEISHRARALRALRGALEAMAREQERS